MANGLLLSSNPLNIHMECLAKGLTFICIKLRRSDKNIFAENNNFVREKKTKEKCKPNRNRELKGKKKNQ